MRKLKALVAGAALVGCLMVVPGIASADPAIVINQDQPNSCGMLGSDANGNLIFGGIGDTTHVIENGNKVTLKCKGDNITNLSGRGQSYRGFGCGIIVPSGGFVFTDDSHATVSASGVGTLTCTYTKT